MHVALFGGSFNPPHMGHALAGLYVLETSDVDELWLVPTFKHPFDKQLISYEDRFAMCEMVASALGPRARVSEVERRLPEPSRTLNTVKALMAEHPGHRFSLIVGSDLEKEITTWYGADELLRLVPLIVVGRRGTQGAREVAIPDISSSEVRARLARGEPVDDLLPRRVLDYIRRRTLYGEPQ